MTGKSLVACLQTRPRATFEEAVAEAMPLAEQAVSQGARMLFLPEYCGGLASVDGALAPPAASEDAHPMLAAFAEFAAARRVWVHLGSLAVTSAGGRIVNRGLVLDDAGAVRSRYDKIHLFDVDLAGGESYRESEIINPGDQAVVADTPVGALGLSICYDLRFPHLYRDLAQSGAEALAIPAAFTRTTGQAHWHILNRARAIENTAYVIAPCAAGEVPGGGACYGHSLIIAPWGEILAEGGEDADLVMAEIDLSVVATVRGQVPSLTHDRPFASARTADLAAE